MALLWLTPALALGQSLEVLRIDLEGLVKTKDVTVLRELNFTSGDTLSLSDITNRFDRNRDNLLNTALFTDVEINITEWNTNTQQVVVSITVKEAWYLYIIPIAELADRNINVWIQEHAAAFNRVNIGVRLIHINMTGVRDRLKFKAQFGYTKRFETKYELPYFNREKTLGGFMKASWSANKEVVYLNQGNKELFYKDDDKDVLRRFQAQAAIKFRPNLYFTHEALLGFDRNWTAEQIAEDNNPDFFLKGRTRQNFLSLRYVAEYDKRDLQLLPTSGPRIGLELLKQGLGIGDINTLYVSPYGEYYIPLSPKLTLGAQAKVHVGLIRTKPPFYNYVGLGYGSDYVRGYEIYVINGLDYYLAKAGIKIKMAETRLDWKRKLPKAFRVMSIQLFVTTNIDIGYVTDPFYSEGNPLVNRTIYGGGPGLTIMLYNTFAFHMEYNFNDLGENGIFLQTRTSF
jgi:outer membrane protein assembly factor BamA